MGSCPDTDIDPSFLLIIFFQVEQVYLKLVVDPGVSMDTRMFLVCCHSSLQMERNFTS